MILEPSFVGPSCWNPAEVQLRFIRVLFAFVFIRPVGARRDLFSSIVLSVLDGTIFLSLYEVVLFLSIFLSSMVWMQPVHYSFLEGLDATSPFRVLAVRAAARTSWILIGCVTDRH